MTKFNPIRIIAFGVLLAAVALAGCSQKEPAGMLRVGLSEEPRTLNIWLASDANSRKILSKIYQPLYQHDPETLELIPWLAADLPEYDPETVAYTVRLRGARWSDGAELTSSDVAFTAKLIKEFRIPRHYSRWKFVTRIETPDKRTVRFFLKNPKAIFRSRSLTIPIVQQKEWEDIVRIARTKEKPLAELLNHQVESPVGTGPFVLKQWREGAYLHMVRNPYFFGTGKTIAGRQLGPHITDIVVKIFGTSDVAILALKKGTIDMFWWGIQPGYLDDLRNQDDIHVYFSEKSALYFMGFNLRKPPSDDPHLRRAIATLIDKNFIISRILQGFGTEMYSIIPPGNRYWYYPEVEKYGAKLDRESRIRKAYDILTEAGYSWEAPPIDDAGAVIPASGIRLPNGQPMERFTILTPPADYDPHRAISGLMIQEWLRDVGMPAYSRPMAFSSLLQQVKGRHDFDTFILGCGKLSTDPDYLRIFFLSANDKPRGWNMSGYRNPEFDKLATESSQAMDREERQALVRKMQEIVLRDVPYYPIYDPLLIEAVRTDRFTGWVEMLEGIGNIWSFTQLKPISRDS
ncbi:Oligopeptide ABC transporter, periplasmic oligopeptide-binding protein OppA (TC 3.A.1.5.1) [Olavius algarvensis associated proteobacterium Delta 3]|nr:Oligopeptide ABC transporter, periplasmic oligopeptide-binding protein OppA (TC 3.A.1.5.1) [Olavius algarvensis associated proteobacterium Delta 3]